ncbi:hypothetical protein PNEG_03456 [Pneumocystis murina B123]|uniref:DNA polymerase epsilon subunit D n=1 Tax=Pneumocystis murina (strain B123) TaxID=1069680 RepID=M7PC12_PNEMU|nr:hypothetical protein PNEG_03456 [Pneumocystis murina B123]EMR08014.1 hypothetical protein PNEG_03456 [Pneumocystis murina B123]
MTNEHDSSNELHLSPASISSKKKSVTVSIDDLNLPRSVVLRLAKKVLPEHTSIQKDAITALIRGSSVFINYLSAAAFDLSKLSSRKVILPSDVLKAMENIEFSSFIPRMTEELELYEEILKEKKNIIELHKNSSIFMESKDEHIIKKIKIDDNEILEKTIRSDVNKNNEYDNHTIDGEDYSKVEEIDKN